jgi:hypothetical protein
MSLVNQPIVRKGTLVRRVDNYITAGTGAFSGIVPMGTNNDSCSFATSTNDHIVVNEAGKYRVSFSGYARLTIAASSGICIFSLTGGATNVGLFLAEIGSPAVVTFKSSLFYDYGASALAGALPIVNSSNPSITANCNITASADIFMNSGDLIRFNLVKSAGISSIVAGLAGEIYLEQIS